MLYNFASKLRLFSLVLSNNNKVVTSIVLECRNPIVPSRTAFCERVENASSILISVFQY